MTLATAAWGYDGLSYTGKDMRQLVAAAFPSSGVVGTDDFLVAAQASPNATVQVAAGRVIVSATGAGLFGSYEVWNDASINSTSFSPTSGNGRWDYLILRVTAGVPALEIVAGTAAASPAAPTITGDNYATLALVKLPGSTTNITNAMITDARSRAASAPSSVPHTTVTRRVLANTNTFTNQTTYGDLPNATDKAALDSTFTKYRSDTKLVVRLAATAELTSGAAQLLTMGLRVASTDYDVAQFRSLIATSRSCMVGEREISGIAAGSVTVTPRFKSAAASAVSFWASDDYVTYSVTETN